MQIRIHTNSKFVPKASSAAWVPWFNHIFCRDTKPTVHLIAHELKHVEQWHQHGLMFPILYGLQWLQVGRDGHKMPFEIAAHEAADEKYYLDWAKEVLTANGLL